VSKKLAADEAVVEAALLWDAPLQATFAVSRLNAAKQKKDSSKRSIDQLKSHS